MVDDPAVRSVRIAVVLCDRFAELLKGPSSVTAAKRNSSMVGISGNESELTLRIGEAQQIYPEIWRHLDEARTAFAGRGVAVTAYDTLRAAEGAGLGANVQTSSKEVAGRYGHQSTTKDANFNREGFLRARSACKALMEATPDIDWAAIAKAEANDPAAAAFGRATRNRRYMMFGALALVIGSPFIYVMWTRHQEEVEREERHDAWKRRNPPPAMAKPLSETERAELTTRVAHMKAAYDAALANWSKTMSAEALAAAKPGTAQCTTTIQAPAANAVAKFIETNDIDQTAFASSDFRAYIAAQGPIPEGVIAGERRRLDAIERALLSGTADAGTKDALTGVPMHYVLVVIDKDVEPHVTATAPIAYEPGSVTGRGYVYSVLSGTATCAAAINAKNPPANPLPTFLETARRAPEAADMLHRQLEVAIRQELAANLKLAVP